MKDCKKWGILNFKWHPQPSSLRISMEALRLADIRGSIILDPFCGTGTLLIAAVNNFCEKAIGSDIEDWSFCIRKELKKWILNGSNKVELHWNIDAKHSIRCFEHDVLVTDPPNPFRIGSLKPYSAKEDTGLFPSELEKFWRDKLSKNNLMGKGFRTIAYVIKLVKTELESGKRVIVNLFKDSAGFNYQKYFNKYFNIKHIYGYFYEVLSEK